MEVEVRTWGALQKEEGRRERRELKQLSFRQKNADARRNAGEKEKERKRETVE